MGEDTKYTIAIGTTANNAGIETTKTGLNDLGRAADNVTDATKTMGKAGEEAGEKTSHAAEHSEISHHELKEAVHAVSKEFGGLADVGLWLNPQLAAIA